MSVNSITLESSVIKSVTAYTGTNPSNMNEFTNDALKWYIQQLDLEEAEGIKTKWNKA